MVGEASKGILGFILANMLTRIYECLFRPGDLAVIFNEYDDEIFNVIRDGRFASVFYAMKAIGLGLLVVSFLITLMDKVSAGDFTIHNFFVHWLRFFIMFVLLNNATIILRYIMGVSTDLFTSLDGISRSGLQMELGNEINELYLAKGINRYFGIANKIIVFMMAIIPYAIACLYSVVINFFAISRLLEMVLRISMSPLVAGISFATPGLQSDFWKYMKRTAGLFFQIIVVFLISVGLTVAHNSLVQQGTVTSSEKISNPASCLLVNDDARQIKMFFLNDDSAYNDITDDQMPGVEDALIAYTEDSINEFIQEMFGVDSFFVSIGIMLSGLFMLFKSRDLSMRLFD